MQSLIELIQEPTRQTPVEILQLYDELELLRLGSPPHHSLFVLGREPLSAGPDTLTTGNPATNPARSPDADRLLLIDPPADLHDRFRIEGDAACLLTHAIQSRKEHDASHLHLPRLQTRPRGTAHIRMGRHYLDIYTQAHYAAVYFPALGILYGGVFGSNEDLPLLADEDDGSDALEMVRLLAALVKSRTVRLWISKVGELGKETVPIMERLASDVAYLHNLRRIGTAPAMLDSVEKRQTLGETLLPQARRGPLARKTHQQNLEILHTHSQV